MLMSKAITELEKALSPQNVLHEIEERYAIYPNPATTEFMVNVNGNANVKIFDMTGRCVKDVNIVDDAVVDIKDLNTGIYFVNVNGKVEKLVVK